LKAGNGNLRSADVTEEADNNGFLSHSTGLDNSLPSFQEYAP